MYMYVKRKTSLQFPCVQSKITLVLTAPFRNRLRLQCKPLNQLAICQLQGKTMIFITASQISGNLEQLKEQDFLASKPQTLYVYVYDLFIPK